ncbi:hypothetical protein CGLO_03220 [Colletotrichum gloeosporioides Cg-14]|uniref:Uncharacterized protein n=1 Tax=Colletotrichum gloeosporioides (strain Cg-14) TaxID=1237896 RepID=T0KW42_COLGC|nr:hypothetical protein CGLO_03220 [Colletotrichum gloeosporioides Cg-14]
MSWTVYEDLAEPGGDIVLVPETGLTKRFATQLGFTKTRADPAVDPADVNQAPNNLLADALFKDGEPDEVPVRDVLPFPNTAGWDTFANVQTNNTLTVRADTRTWNHFPLEFQEKDILGDPEYRNWTYDGLLGRWRPGSRKVFRRGSDGQDWVESIAFAENLSRQESGSGSVIVHPTYFNLPCFNYQAYTVRDLRELSHQKMFSEYTADWTTRAEVMVNQTIANGPLELVNTVIDSMKANNSTPTGLLANVLVRKPESREILGLIGSGYALRLLLADRTDEFVLFLTFTNITARTITAEVAFLGGSVPSETRVKWRVPAGESLGKVTVNGAPADEVMGEDVVLRMGADVKNVTVLGNF